MNICWQKNVPFFAIVMAVPNVRLEDKSSFMSCQLLHKAMVSIGLERYLLSDYGCKFDDEENGLRNRYPMSFLPVTLRFLARRFQIIFQISS